MKTTTSSSSVESAPADPAFDDLLADLERPIHEGVITSNAIQMAKDLDVQALIPDSVFLMERKCLLLTLQVRMLLREMTEYKLKAERMKNGNLSIEEMANIIALSPDQTDDRAWILGTIDDATQTIIGALMLFLEIGELKRMIIQENRKNYLLEQELKKLEKKISLLIANRTSIQVRANTLAKRSKKFELFSFVTYQSRLNTANVNDDLINLRKNSNWQFSYYHYYTRNWIVKNAKPSQRSRWNRPGQKLICWRQNELKFTATCSTCFRLILDTSPTCT